MILTQQEVQTLITALRLIEWSDALTEAEEALLEKAYKESRNADHNQ